VKLTLRAYKSRVREVDRARTNALQLQDELLRGSNVCSRPAALRLCLCAANAASCAVSRGSSRRSCSIEGTTWPAGMLWRRQTYLGRSFFITGCS
jgi:hypothetical protein